MKTNKNRAQGSLEYMMMIAIALTIIIGAAVLINQLMSSMKIKTEADADLNKILSTQDPTKITKIADHIQKYYAIRKGTTINFGSIDVPSGVLLPLKDNCYDFTVSGDVGCLPASALCSTIAAGKETICQTSVNIKATPGVTAAKNMINITLTAVS